MSATAAFDIKERYDELDDVQPGDGVQVRSNGIVTGVAIAGFATATVLNVKDYGAAGDFVQDDTGIINTVIDEAPSGATVLIPAGGTYKITLSDSDCPLFDDPTKKVRAGVRINRSDIRLIIDGELKLADNQVPKNASYATGNSSAQIVFLGDGTTAYENIVIDGHGTIHGNKSNDVTNGTGSGNYAERSIPNILDYVCIGGRGPLVNVQIRDLTLRGSGGDGYCFRDDSGDRGQYLSITNVTIRECVEGGNILRYDHVKVMHPVVHDFPDTADNLAGIAAADQPIAQDGIEMVESNHWVVANGVFRNVPQSAIDAFNSVTYGTISGNVIDATGGQDHGISIGTGVCENITISGNTILVGSISSSVGGGAGISVVVGSGRHKNITITNNAIGGTRSGASGIFADTVDNITIAGNVIDGAGSVVWNGTPNGNGRGIHVANSSGVVINGNAVSDSEDAGIYSQLNSTVQVIGNTVRDSGLVAGGLTIGIYLDGPSDGSGSGIVMGNKAYDSRSGGSRTQTEGIRIFRGTMTVIGNQAANNTTADFNIQNTQAASLVRTNIGIADPAYQFPSGWVQADDGTERYYNNTWSSVWKAPGGSGTAFAWRVGADVTKMQLSDSGTLTAAAFSGPLDASNLTGTIATARLPASYTKLTSTVSTTSATASDVTGLSFPIGAGETWEFRVHLRATCSSTGGMKFAVTVPSGATLDVGVIGMASTTSVRQSNLSASGTLSGNQFIAFTGTDGDVEMTGEVTNSTTAGTVQVQFAAFTAGQTCSVLAGSFISATRKA